ncbi:MAG: PEGA domain-containing protein [Vicinamibacterales bacterium]
MPTRFGVYSVLHQIGSGTSGPVFRAHDLETGRLAAIKVFVREWSDEDRLRVATGLESLAAAQMPHDRMVALYEAGDVEGVAYLAMEFQPAETLEQALRRLAPAPVDRALPLLVGLATAIDAGWKQRMGHGALSPRDIFVSPTGELAAITGFGVAQALARAGQPEPGRRVYTAPEQSQIPLDIRADVFALGALAHELLTGRRPIAPGEQDGELGAEVPPRRRVHIRAVLATALAKDPAARFHSAHEFVQALAETAGLDAERESFAQAGAASRPASDLRSVLPAVSPPMTRAPEPNVVMAGARPDRAESGPSPASRDESMPAPDFPSESRPSSMAPSVPVVTAGIDPDVFTSQAPLGQAMGREDVLGDAPMARAALPLRNGSITHAPAPGPRAWRSSFTVSLMAAIGLLIGGGAAYLQFHRPVADPAQQGDPVATGGTASVSGSTSVLPPAESVDSAPSPPAGPAQQPTSASPLPRRPAAEGRQDATTTPRRTAALPGRVTVNSEPTGAMVTIDGHFLGATPAAATDLSIGAHTVMVARPGYVPRSEQVVLTAGSPAQALTIRLQAGLESASRSGAELGPPPRGDGSSASTGSIDVDSRPRGARVNLDGRFVGLAPLRLAQLQTGAHTVTLESPGRPAATRRVRVDAGQVATVRINME